MKITTLISGSLALALVATSMTPAFTAPASRINSDTGSSFEQVQYRLDSTDEDQIRRQRRGDGERPAFSEEAQPRRRAEQGQRPQRGEEGQRRQRAEWELQNRQYRAETVRPERRGDDGWQRSERGERRAERNERRDQRREHRFERRGNQAYFNGQRGYREQRRGYRYYEGFWFPATAFVLGAIIAGQNNNYRNDDWEDHTDWCYERYGRNYRERDNTYISRSGYRRECVSPYS